MNNDRMFAKATAVALLLAGLWTYSRADITVNPPLGLSSASSAFTCTAAGVCTIASAPLSALTGLAANCATWLATSTSANLAACLTNETGTGNAVFSDSPTFTTLVTVGTSGQNTVKVNGTSTADQSPIYSSNRSGSVEWVRGVDSSNQFVIAANPASYTDANLASATQFKLTTGGNGTFTGSISGTLANTASTSAVCYNTSSKLLTYNSTVGTCTVSRLAAKDLVAPLTPEEGCRIVMAMEPWRYNLKNGLPTYKPGEQIGFIADYAIKHEPRLVATDGNGKVEGFLYEQYTAALTSCLQYAMNKLADNDNFVSRITELERKMALQELKADNDNLRAEIGAAR